MLRGSIGLKRAVYNTSSLHHLCIRCYYGSERSLFLPLFIIDCVLGLRLSPSAGQTSVDFLFFLFFSLISILFLFA
jgi:hypothetical protein